MNPVYLDYAATTPLDSRVLEEMIPYFSDEFGNPSSAHLFGQRAESALEKSRRSLAEDLNCLPGEVIFTSCGSESDNLALRGGALAGLEHHGADHILISPIEHPAVYQTARELHERHNFDVEYLPVDSRGMVDPQVVIERLRPGTALVSVIHANNEIGTINPISEIGAICRAVGVPFHTDSVQGAAHTPIDVYQLNVDLLSIGAHKFYGPKGVGALYVRGGNSLIPHLTGGSQEFGLRAGTENVPLIVGLSRAFHFAQSELEERSKRLQALRDELISTVLDVVPDAELTGHPQKRLPNHTSFVFREADGNFLVSLLDSAGYACSSGSACKTGKPAPSRVLRALGFSPAWASGGLRVTLGIPTTLEDLEGFLDILPGCVEKARKRS